MPAPAGNPLTVPAGTTSALVTVTWPSCSCANLPQSSARAPVKIKICAAIPKINFLCSVIMRFLVPNMRFIPYSTQQPRRRSLVSLRLTAATAQAADVRDDTVGATHDEWPIPPSGGKAQRTVERNLERRRHDRCRSFDRRLHNVLPQA